MNKPLRLGIAGLGTVGMGLWQLLAEHGAEPDPGFCCPEEPRALLSRLSPSRW